MKGLPLSVKWGRGWEEMREKERGLGGDEGEAIAGKQRPGTLR